MLKIIDFYADWCSPCIMMDPIVEELSKELKGKVEFERIDVDKNSEAAGKYDVGSIPTFVILKNGKEIERIVGYRGKTQFKQIIEAHL